MGMGILMWLLQQGAHSVLQAERVHKACSPVEAAWKLLLVMVVLAVALLKGLWMLRTISLWCVLRFRASPLYACLLPDLPPGSLCNIPLHNTTCLASHTAALPTGEHAPSAMIVLGASQHICMHQVQCASVCRAGQHALLQCKPLMEPINLQLNARCGQCMSCVLQSEAGRFGRLKKTFK